METITTRDAEWDDSDRGIVMAAIDIRADRHKCGHAMSEVLKLAPADQPEGYVEPKFVGEARECLACIAEADYLRRWEKVDKEQRIAGEFVYPDARIITVRRTN